MIVTPPRVTGDPASRPGARWLGLIRERVCHPQSQDGLGAWQQRLGIARELHALWRDPAHSREVALSNILQNQLTFASKRVGRCAAYQVEAKLRGIGFDLTGKLRSGARSRSA